MPTYDEMLGSAFVFDAIAFCLILYWYWYLKHFLFILLVENVISIAYKMVLKLSPGYQNLLTRCVRKEPRLVL